MTNIALAVNESRLIGMLQHAFSGSVNVVAELLQNARRAHATEVRFSLRTTAGNLVLEIVDDGDGIKDFQKLLQLAESDWDARIVEAESPYGVGFLAALYAGRHIYVHSGSTWLSEVTDHVLRQRPVALHAGEHRKGTRVVIEGLDVAETLLRQAVSRLSRGFPIPVYFDGELCDRPHAASSAYAETDVGCIGIPGLNLPGSLDKACADYYSLYLQGLPVSCPRRSGATVVHLDPRQFVGRWPDREQLFDEDTAFQKVREAIRRHVGTYLAEEKAKLGDEAFIECYVERFGREYPELFRDVGFAHRQLLAVVEDYPKYGAPRYDTLRHTYRAPTAHAERQALEAGDVLLIDTDYVPDHENIRAWMAVYGNPKALAVLEPTLLPEWAKGHVLSSEDLDVVLRGETAEARYAGTWCGGEVVFCDAYRIVDRAGRVIAEHAAVGMYELHYGTHDDGVEWSEERFVVPSQERSGQAVNQATDFLDEVESYDEAANSEEVRMFSRFIASERDQDIGSVLRSALENSDVADLDNVRSRRFFVTIDERGQVAVSVKDEYRLVVQACYEGQNSRGIRLEASRFGDPGIYNELRVGVYEGDKCVGDVVIGLSPDQELRLLVTGNGEGDGDPMVAVFPERDSDALVEDWDSV